MLIGSRSYCLISRLIKERAGLRRLLLGYSQKARAIRVVKYFLPKKYIWRQKNWFSHFLIYFKWVFMLIVLIDLVITMIQHVIDLTSLFKIFILHRYDQTAKSFTRFKTDLPKKSNPFFIDRTSKLPSLIKPIWAYPSFPFFFTQSSDIALPLFRYQPICATHT